jgi:predicted nucleotidyltransferase
MDKGTAIEHVRQYADLVRRHFDVRSVVLFGSYAQGTAREDSDIDVAVVVDEIHGDWLTSAAKLHSLTRDIDIMIEPIILDPRHDRSGFLEHILKTGEVIYSREG